MVWNEKPNLLTLDEAANELGLHRDMIFVFMGMGHEFLHAYCWYEGYFWSETPESQLIKDFEDDYLNFPGGRFRGWARIPVELVARLRITEEITCDQFRSHCTWEILKDGATKNCCRMKGYYDDTPGSHSCIINKHLFFYPIEEVELKGKPKWAYSAVSITSDKLVFMADEVKQFKQCCPKLIADHRPSETAGQIEKKKSISDKEERTDLHLIAGLLELLLESTQEELQESPPYSSQGKIIKILVRRLDGAFGLSKSNIEKRFSQANKRLAEALND